MQLLNFKHQTNFNISELFIGSYPVHKIYLPQFWEDQHESPDLHNAGLPPPVIPSATVAMTTLRGLSCGYFAK